MEEEADLQAIRSKIERAVSRVAPRRLGNARDDLVQASMIRLLAILEKREQKGPLAASYLWKVAHSVTIDEIRKLKARRETPIEELEMSAPPVGEAADPERALRSGELGDAIRGCLARMVEARRVAVAMHLLGHSLDESTRLTGWDGKRVRNALYRGMADLRQCLTRKGYTP